MTKSIVVLVATIVAVALQAGDSAPFLLDTIMASPRVDFVPWNAAWIGGDPDASVVIMDNGSVVKRATRSGELSLDVGRHELRYRTYIADVAQAESYTATVYRCNCACELGDVPLVEAAKAATCTEAGWAHEVKCGRCNVIFVPSTTIPALGHDGVETTTAKAATCTEAGWTHEVKCGRCNVILELSTTISALGHDGVETKTAKSPTCTDDGWTREVKCSRCNDILEASITIPKLGHVEVVTKPAVEPNDSTAGLTAEISCSRCGKVLQPQKTILAVSTVTAKQRYPWNGFVDITCRVACINGTTNGLKFVVETVAPDSGITNKMSHFWVARGGENSTDVEVHTNGEYRLVWDAQADLGEIRCTNMVISVAVKGHSKIQLWAGGPYWADTNIGADEPWEGGYFFQWGDTVGYKYENDILVRSDDSGSGIASDLDRSWPITANKTASMLQDEGLITQDGVLAPTYDAAHVQWGEGWRMPNIQELRDIRSKCDWTLIILNGVRGYLVSGREDYSYNSIFLPFAGQASGSRLYSVGSFGASWSSVPGPGYMNTYGIGCNSNEWYIADGFRRYDGMSIRPVQVVAADTCFVNVAVQACNSAPFVLDTVMASPRVDSVPWNAAWISGEQGATVIIMDNGSEVKRATGAGELSLGVGRHELLYRTYVANVEQPESYTATVYRCNCACELGDVPLVETKTAKSPTCTEIGWTHEVKCGRCNVIFEPSITIPALGHIAVETKTARVATCTAYGWTHEVKCSRCNEILEASVTIPGGHIVSETKAAKAATCTEDGWTRETKCSRCNTIVATSTAIPALGHLATETKAAKAATCTEDGWTHEVKCSRCSVVLEASETIAGLGGSHVWQTLAAVEPTCTADGHTAGQVCSRCGATQNSEVRPALGHLGATTKSAVAPTSATSGLTAEITCSRCGEVLQEQTEIPALGYIRNVIARQLWPHKKVEVRYELAEDINEVAASSAALTLTCTYGSTTKTATSSRVYGDAGCVPGVHCIVWDFEGQSIAINQSSVTFKVKYSTKSGVSDAISVNTSSSVSNGMSVNGQLELGYSPFADGEVKVLVDGEIILSSTNSGVFAWQPQTAGPHTIKHVSGTYEWTRTVAVNTLVWTLPPTPYPPTAEDENISIGSTTKAFAASGGSGTITTSGSGTWSATASDSWITIPSALSSRNAGLPVVYQVAANAGVEARTGYVYISGHVFTVTQAGVGAALAGQAPYQADFGPDGGAGSFTVLANTQSSWQVRSNVDWISIGRSDGDDAAATSGANGMRGIGEGEVCFTVAPYNEIATRSGTITAAGCTFTVNQTGRAMKLSGGNITSGVSGLSSSFDYLSHVLPITITAFASTEWDVEPGNSWISVVDGGSGHGGGSATIAINENPSWIARSGTVRIGTETLTINQSGRPSTAIDFAISPEESTASVKGANGLIAVMATPDLPWTAQSQANWLTVMPALQNGAGNGNVVYAVSPNPTMSDRSGSITVTRDGGGNDVTKTHSVCQPGAVVTVSETNHVFDAAGESYGVEVTADDIVNWTISENVGWLSVVGEMSRIGPGTVTLVAEENPTIYPRSASLTIAGHQFAVSQDGRTIEVEYDSRVFGSSMEYSSLDVHPDGNVQWIAASSDQSWLTIWSDETCSYDDDGNVIATGDHTIEYIVTDYVGDGTPRTATITIGDKTVYITQRPYDLSINPSSAVVSGNAGEGEVGVPATVGQIWNAIATEPWIIIKSGYDSGTGSGSVLFAYTDNNTGKVRTGKIIIAGEEYTLTQAAREMVALSVTARVVTGSGEQGTGNGGTVSGAGTYDRGTVVPLSAVARDGYVFVNWTLPGGSTANANPLSVTADANKEVIANFRRIPVCSVNGESVREGTSKTFTAPADIIDENGTRKLVCRGTSRYPDKGTSFSVVVNEDIDFEWDMWTTNYLVTVEQTTGGTIREGGSQSSATAMWVESGTTINLSAVPDTGKSFFRWLVNGSNDLLSLLGVLEFGSNGVPSNLQDSETPSSESNNGSASLRLCVENPITVSAVFGTFSDTLATALDAPTLTFTTGGDGSWLPVIDATAQTGYTSACSGAIGAEAETWLDTTVEGAGTLTFRWRVDCEKDDGGGATWDRLAVFTNGVEVARIDGKTDWQTVTINCAPPAAAAGDSRPPRTTIRWSFYRDDWDETGQTHENCAWVDGVTFTAKEGE